MSFETGLWLALVRATVVALLVVPAASLVSGWIKSASLRLRRCVATLLIAIVLTPMLVLGYVYSSGELTLVRYPFWNDVLYAMLLCAKLLPIAVGVFYFGPPAAVSDSARYGAGLVSSNSAMGAQPLRSRLALWMQANGRVWLLAGIAVFLLSFGEFELASLLNGSSGRQASAYSWTIALHESRELRVPLTTLWGRTAAAVAIQLCVIGTGLVVLVRSDRSAATERHDDEMPIGARSRSRHLGACVVLATAVALALLLPWAIVLRGGIGGMSSLFGSFTFGKELWHSVLMAGASATLVLIAVALLRVLRCRPIIIMLLCVPGLCSGLVLSLTFVQLSQSLGEHFYDSPLPLIGATVLWLLPLAVVLRWLFDVTERRSAMHAATMLARSPSTRKTMQHVRWQLRGRSWYWLAVLLFTLAYFELILSVLLAPTSMTTAMALLYNLFHYGQNAVRSAMVLVLVAVPIGLMVGSWVGLQIIQRRSRR